MAAAAAIFRPFPLTLKIIECYIEHQIGNVSNLTLVSSPREVTGALGGAGFFVQRKTVVSG
jgi:hypothetical protein